MPVTQGRMTQSALRWAQAKEGSAQCTNNYVESSKSKKPSNGRHRWRGGQAAQLMVFEASDHALPGPARHRNEEVREVIGDHYEGTLCTDRGKSYDAKALAETKQQKCLSHILRSIDEPGLHGCNAFGRYRTKCLRSSAGRGVCSGRC